MDDHLNSLYETDALIWTDYQITLLRAGHFDHLDLEHIISELGYQVRRDKREVETRIELILPYTTKSSTSTSCPAKTKKPLIPDGINGFEFGCGDRI